MSEWNPEHEFFEVPFDDERFNLYKLLKLGVPRGPKD